MTTADTETEHTGLGWPARSGPTHQPWRSVVALAEVVAAALLVWLAAWLWSRGTVDVADVPGRPDLAFRRYEGPWIGGSLAAAALACGLVLDAARQVVLALRTRARET